MRSKLKIAMVLLACVFLLTGCKTTLLVHQTTVQKLIPIVKDYAGSHGYRINYENDQTGAFGIDMGAVYVPYSSSTTKSSSYIQTQSPGNNQPLTAYEQTTWNTVGNSEHFEEAAASINMLQQGEDVLMTLDGNDAAGSSLNDFYDYLKSLGYQVESK